ncbi:MAG: ArsR/SmtB family transcription factor [Dissulfurimicrobium sp.]|uniref:ArsR/SmtB family transcription factor n=1 Tax=Dissulfurimicrobium sp. TaxID=2022436 RepID=UPI00404997AD
MKKLIRCLKAVSDPTRFKILKLLQHRKAYVCELTSVLGLAQPTISRHLAILEDAGLVTSKRAGLWMEYMLPENPASEAGEVLGLVLRWQENSEEIAELRTRLDYVNREAVCKTL